MTDQTNQIVQKLWNYCNVLRDDLSACEHAQADGMSYGDYIEQLTYLLFLKVKANSGDTILISLIRAAAMRLWDYPSAESILGVAEGLRTG